MSDTLSDTATHDRKLQRYAGDALLSLFSLLSLLFYSLLVTFLLFLGRRFRAKAEAAEAARRTAAEALSASETLAT